MIINNNSDDCRKNDNEIPSQKSSHKCIHVCEQYACIASKYFMIQLIENGNPSTGNLFIF